MENKLLRLSLLPIVIICIGITACANPPYIHDKAKFNREHAEFAKVRTDRDTVTVCYWRNDTTAQEVANIANNACQPFGKVAVLESQDLKTCPLQTPVAANFRCVADANPTYQPQDSDGFATSLIKTLRGF